MANRKKILVAIELDGWQRALGVAREIASGLAADIVLVHVVQPMTNVYPDLPESLFARVGQEVQDESRRALEQITATTGGCRVILRTGDPASEILETVASEAPFLLVMGTHGRRGLRRLLLGSVAEHVLRDCAVPVLTVKPEEARPAS